MEYPPAIHNIKAFYLSKEMVRRGVVVNWVQLGGNEGSWKEDGIRFSVLRALRKGPFPEAFQILRLVVFCLGTRINLVYEDEWLFLRKKPTARLLGNMILRIFGVKIVLDQRDPFVDFEVAAGELTRGSSRFKRFALLRPLLLRQADLIILPSKAYAATYLSEGIPTEKVLGIFRGVDPKLFRPRIGPSNERSQLGLDGKFVVGWFGLMHPYRMISEIIIPLIENLPKEIPNVHFLIGGEGPLLQEFERIRTGPHGESFTLLGIIPYVKLPDYIAACDVTLCPVSTKFRFTMNSNWLKIGESIAMGTPMVASRTRASDLDFSGVGGVVWADSDFNGFFHAICELEKNLGFYRGKAKEQAEHFGTFSIGSTIPIIVDRTLALN
jgi:glycosyltransferase involved in cell wall biosynthesis